MSDLYHGPPIVPFYSEPMQFGPIDPDVDTPPFEQLRQQIARQTTSGELSPGEKLPTVRSLAAELGLAVNTVARTYKELETDGVVATHGRRGTFVASTQAIAPATLAATEYTETLRRQGLGLHEAVRLVEEAWAQSTRH